MFEHANKTFKNAIKPLFVTGLALSMAFAPSAMAGSDNTVCAPEDKAKVVNLSKQYGLFTLDFTNSSRACLEDFAGGTSHKYLVYVAESDSPSHRKATVVAAKIDKQEGIPVFVAFSGDRDGSPRTADTFIWANGAEIALVPERVKEGYTVEMLISIDPDPTINEMHRVAHDVFTKYHTIPPLASNAVKFEVP